MTSPRARLDARPYACPMSWVKTRVALDRLAEGEVLEVLLAAGPSADDVPRTAAEDGHVVLAIEPVAGDAVRVLLEKGPPAPELP